MKSIIQALLIAVVAHSLPAHAESNPLQQMIAGQHIEYVVSGVLRSSADGIVIKLVQGVQVANSRDEAIGAFAREALSQYPGYSLIDTLATPLSTKAIACSHSI